MLKTISTRAARFLFLALLGSAGLATTACKKDAAAVVSPPQDFSAIDDAIIQKYLADNVITTAVKQTSGLYYRPMLTNPGTFQARAGNTVYVLYTGRLMDGTVFDASSQHGNVPINFVLGQGRVIRGWDEGIALMHKGDKAVLYIPSALAYGANGAPPSIPQNAVLRFEVELTEIR